MNKHAYLIIAHNNFEILERTLKLLDDEKNDFYIHIDKKIKNFNFEKFKNIVKKSKIIFTERINVKWGHSSQINCELILLKTAIKNNYSYYHLLSGVDMPIKSKKEIYNFFESNKGKEFVHFSILENKLKIEKRYIYYHLFPYRFRSSYKYVKYIMKKIEKIFFRLQKILKINRIRSQKIDFFYGSQWFSITNDFVRYVLLKEKWIQNTFKYTSCCDEVFMQTLIMNSEFKENLYDKQFDDNHIISVRRYIDWERGTPYTFRKKDFKELINSKALFARKFDLNVDKEIIDMIFKKFYNEN